MFDAALNEIWKRAEAGAPRLSRAELENLLRPMARWSERALVCVAWAYAALLVPAAVLAAANLPGYAGNATMLLVEAGLLVASLGAAAYSGFVALGLQAAGRSDLPLAVAVERRLGFHDRWYGPWLVVGALTPWLLTMAINTWIDNQGGRYPIHHPVEFAVVTAVMIGFTWVMLRISLAPSVRAMRAVLHDVQAEVLDATAAIAPLRRRSRVLVAAGTVLLVLGVSAGLWLWWQAS